MSIDGARALLDGWTAVVAADAPAPVAGAARILAGFGAEHAVSGDARSELRLRAPGGRTTGARLARWKGEAALGSALRSFGDGSREPNGSVLTAYAALRLAGAAVAGARTTLDATELVRELLVALHLAGPNRPELVRCRDGWVVARLRDEAEQALFRALTGAPAECDRADVVAQARLARLLVAPVERPPAQAPLELGAGTLRGPRRAPRPRSRVVDWTVLWAGPWAAQELRRDGAQVRRVEHPRRRDGLLAWPSGKRWWRALNQRKRLALLDARDPADRRALEAAIGEADVLLTSMTPRALTSLGFDADWRRERAPGLLHLELVAFEDPWADAPGLGEHAAAQAGLLWRAHERPGAPYPWADPLLGAAALTLSRIWLASERRGGGHVRLTLERAASLAFALDCGAVHDPARRFVPAHVGGGDAGGEDRRSPNGPVPRRESR